MSDIANSTISVFKRSRGLTLVFLGFTIVYFTVGLGGIDEKNTTINYFVIGFTFLLAIAGIFITYLELRSSEVTIEPLEISSEKPDFEHAVRQLSRNYDVLRRQATQGFVLAGTFMTLGILVILAGSVGEMFGFTKEGSDITTVAGVVVEVISGLGLYLFKQTSERLNITSDRLHDTWKILMAFSKAEALPEEKKSEVIAALITKLVESSERGMG